MMSKSKYENLEDAKKHLLKEIDATLATRGVWNETTCPTGEPFGWDMMVHYALEWFQRNQPKDWIINKTFSFGCIDWAIIKN
jgi:hypothetical protein